MKIKYYANDGVSFDSEEKCVEYENALVKKVEEQKKLKEEKESRLKEVNEAFLHAENLLAKYYKDYPDQNSALYKFSFPTFWL